MKFNMFIQTRILFEKDALCLTCTKSGVMQKSYGHGAGHVSKPKDLLTALNKLMKA